MKANHIRQQFLDFFQSKGHQIVPSAPLVIKDDPTLMFTNAGMNQFKDYFLGNKKAEFTRIADTQKCLRVSGKHNDLEEVGLDTYHHTMFEMLGNWSIGDYFKEEAIDWAWELLTDVYGLPKDRLYVTVFGGDKEENLETDNEAFQFWKKHVEKERILYGSKKDNFWEMGDTGPCGPCSEIHIDLRPEKALQEIPGKDLVNEGDPLVIEIWNLVFIQFNRKANGSLELLPQKHVDTGMGFERLAMAIQQKQSNYDTDVFTPIIDEIGRNSGRKYGNSEETDIAMRVIADHLRAVSFAIADGQMPSNNGAGYVIRRILRRAVRYGFTYLGFQEPFIHSLCAVLADQFKDVFPELKAQEDFVARVIREEEASFLRTLENGIRIFEEACQSVKQSNGADKAMISGEIAFRLYDTFGFPLDLTLLLAREKGISVDTEDFKRQMEVQKKRSQAAASKETGDWNIVAEADQITFSGYENLETITRILRYRELKDAKKTSYQLVLENTPFYAESGGQVGDSGIIMVANESIKVLDTHKENDLIVHVVDKLPALLHETVQCKVDANRRMLIEANHSCTHLLHAALREVIGSHVQQRGSLVSDKILRFDFSHFSKLEASEIAQIEAIVNERIRQNISLDEKRNVPIEKAKDMGAMALFGEKYGEFVRVITFNPSYSVELCGGTHVKATGQIGYFKILTESSVAAGVRRIEALTSLSAVNYVDQQLELLNSIREVLKNPKDPVKAVENILAEKSQLHKQVEKYQLEQSKNIKEQLKNKIQAAGKYNVIADVIEMPTADALKKLAFEIKNEVSNLYLVLAASIEEKPQIAVMFSENLVEEDGLDAGQMVRELAREIQGGGGGQKFFATAGGKDVKGLPRVIEKIKSKLAL
jgi:alanyl-tRNA synthetase